MLKPIELIQRLSTLPFVGSLMAIVRLTTAQACTPPKRELPGDLFKEFGVRTLINATGTLTY